MHCNLYGMNIRQHIPLKGKSNKKNKTKMIQKFCTNGKMNLKYSKRCISITKEKLELCPYNTGFPILCLCQFLYDARSWVPSCW